MFEELKRNVTSYQPSSGPFFCSIILFFVSTCLIAALWHAHWSLPTIRCLYIGEDDYSFAGKIEIGVTSIHYELEYNIPAGGLEHVSIRGPLKRGIAAGAPDFALTLCGGESACATAEALTCSAEQLGDNCGRLAGTIKSLDSFSPDAGSEIHRTLNAISEHLNLYVLAVEANGASFSAPIGPVCWKSVKLPTL